MDGSRVWLYSTHNRIFSALGMLLGVLVCALVAAGAGGPGWRVGGLLAGLVLLGWAVRAALIGVQLSDQGVRLRELSRTRVLPWSAVSSVAARPDRRGIQVPELVLAELDRRGRRRVPVMSLASRRPDQIEGWLDALRRRQEAVADSSRERD